MARQKSSRTSTTTTVLSVLILLLSFHVIHAIKWLALANHEPKLDWDSAKTCKKAKGIVMRQVKNMCKRNLDAMPGIEEAARLTVQTCQEQFSDRRWNCSSIKNAPDFTPDLTKETREGAYVYALSAAAIAYSIAIECSSGSITQCGCGRTPREKPEEGLFEWGGCSDNVEFGIGFSLRFADAYLRPKHDRYYTNRHNNKIGRMTVKSSSQIRCKCHGLTGSCNLKTCWKSLPGMEDIGFKLKRKYTGAAEVVLQHTGNKTTLVPRDRNLEKYSENDLIYIQPSPDYCESNPHTGSLGTVGRFCNSTTVGNAVQFDGCDSMCCGRGYKSKVVDIVEQCQCRYQWCCIVKCRECRKTVEVNICK
ncbi:protein Wnt-11b-2-like [Glandiceps talaboti]